MCKHDPEQTVVIAEGGNAQEGLSIELCECGKIIVVSFIDNDTIAMVLDGLMFSRSLNLAIARNGGGGVIA